MAATGQWPGLTLLEGVKSAGRRSRGHHDADDEEVFVDLVGLLGKRLVETRRALAAFSNSSRLTPRGMSIVASTGFFIGAGVERRRGGRGRRAFHFQLQFHLAEAQDLAGLEDAFLDFVRRR